MDGKVYTPLQQGKLSDSQSRDHTQTLLYIAWCSRHNHQIQTCMGSTTYVRGVTA